MKNYLLGMLTVLILGLLSFNKIEEVLTVKPKMPNRVFATSIVRSDIGEYVYKYSKLGYIVHTASAPNDNGSIVLVMYKY